MGTSLPLSLFISSLHLVLTFLLYAMLISHTDLSVGVSCRYPPPRGVGRLGFQLKGLSSMFSRLKFPPTTIYPGLGSNGSRYEH